MNENPPRPAAGPAPRPGRQFFDVVRPGATPANPTSRPVIARPPVKDPNGAMSGVGEAAKLTMARQQVPQPTPAARPIVISTTPVAAPMPPPTPQPEKTVDPAQADSLGKTASTTSVTPPTIDASTFFAPDNPAQHQGSKHGLLSEVLAIFAIFLLLAVILNILLDAEVINLSVPHTNFFDY